MTSCEADVVVRSTCQDATRSITSTSVLALILKITASKLIATGPGPETAIPKRLPQRSMKIGLIFQRLVAPRCIHSREDELSNTQLVPEIGAASVGGLVIVHMTSCARSRRVLWPRQRGSIKRQIWKQPSPSQTPCATRPGDSGADDRPKGIFERPLSVTS
jgi:hypothetical protein